MLDAAKRRELVDKLRGRIKQSDLNVSTNVEAVKGDHKVVMSNYSIDHYYQNQKVGSIKVADLDNEDLEFINTDPHEAAKDMLGEFAKNYDAHKVTAAAHKEAANSAQSDDSISTVTEKQLNETKIKLHPRTNESYINITQKQLPEHGQRPGTYISTTEAQLRDERNTFYGSPRTSGDWRDEDRNTITETQFDEGVKEYSDLGVSDRDRMGAKFTGDTEKQQHVIQEKQINELLKHHTWDEPLTVTEGKDQLGKQDGELSRLSADTAAKIVKEALTALGKTVLSVGITSQNLADVVNRLISHKSKYPVLAQIIKQSAGSDTSAIEKKVASAKYFGKTANTGRDWSDDLAADVLIRQLAQIKQNPEWIVKGLATLSKQADFVSRINESTDLVLAAKEQITPEDEFGVFDQVLNKSACVQEGNSDDGRYAYVGKIEEVQADPSDKNKFASAAAKYAHNKITAEIKQNLDLEPQVIDVNMDEGVFEIQFMDKNAQVEDSMNPERQEKRQKMAQKIMQNHTPVKEADAANQFVKEAQFGGMGGPTPTGGPEMGNPAPPPAPGGDMGQPPPGESLSQPPAAEEPAPEEGSPSGEPTPPFTKCYVCASEDMDVNHDGEWHCNNCGAEGTGHFDIKITKYPGVFESTEEGKEDKGFSLDDGLDAGLDSEGMGSGTTMPNVPVAASVRLTPRSLEKMASQNIAFGSVCPNCGGKNTDLIKSSAKGNDGVCWDCLQEYNVRVKASKNKPNQVYAQFTWKPHNPEIECKSCNRPRVAFLNSLKNYGMSWNEFSGLPNKEQYDTVLKLAKSGWLDMPAIMKEQLPLQKIAASARWKGYEKFDKFPKASCMERIARKFGENATAMSGPCQGKKLTDCVCGQLESLGIYTDGLAAKVAAFQSNENPMVNNPMKTCIAMMVRDHNYAVDDACTICDAMRVAYASAEELAIESIAQVNPFVKQVKTAPQPNAPVAPDTAPVSTPAAQSSPAKPMMGGMGMSSLPAKPMEESAVDLGGNMEPALDSISVEMHGTPDGMDDMGMSDDLDMGEDTVTIKLPAEAAHALEILMNALQGNLSPDMMEQDSLLDMPDVTDDMSGEEMNDENLPSTEDSGDMNSEPVEEDMPSPVEDTSTDNPEATESPIPSEPKHEEAAHEPVAEEKKEIPGLNEHKTEEKEKLVKESIPDKQANTDRLLFSMKTGTNKTYKDSMNNLFDLLLSQAQIKTAEKDSKNDDILKVDYKDAKESKVTAKPAQDAKEIGKYSGDSTIGHEESFSKGVKNKPDVPRSDALMGDEGQENRVNEKSDMPSIATGAAAMRGEGNYKPEKETLVDGNQGSTKSAQVKTATAKCKCGSPGCECKDCKSEACMKPCMCSTKPNQQKTASGKSWTVNQNHKYYSVFQKKASSGEKTITLNDGVTYDMSIDPAKNIILTAAQKESQTATIKNVHTLADDKDVGKVQVDKPHSLGVDEKKPSEGMEAPSIPSAPNQGRLAREHDVNTKLSPPEIPAGGGMNPTYDTNDKNKPEKQEEVLGTNKTTMAASKDEAVKIAGQMLKAQMITIDELPNKVRELSQAPQEILEDYKKLIARSFQGLQRQANADAIENPLIIKTSGANPEADLKDSLQEMFKLDQRNKDYERFNAQKGNLKLFH